MITLDEFIFPYKLTSFRPSWIPSRTQWGLLVFYYHYYFLDDGLVSEWRLVCWEVTVYPVEMEHCIQAPNTSEKMEKLLYLLIALLIFAIYREEVLEYMQHDAHPQMWQVVFINAKMKDYTDISEFLLNYNVHTIKCIYLECAIVNIHICILV